jgi:Zn-finger nucleic acid-binding protein
MNCPRCKNDLKVEDYRGIEVDRCPQCQGIWLDYGELDQLEDLVLDEDEIKGTMMYSPLKGELSCPKCNKPMQRFSYRAYNLELDFCEQGHGTWLDAGEEKRVLEIMEQRIKDLNRKAKAEAEWGDFLGKLRSPSFFGKVKGLFRR